MGQFANALGILEFEITGKYIELRPEMGDKRKLLKISIKGKDENKQSEMLDEMYQFTLSLFKRAYPDEPTKELEEFIETNLIELINEILIGFKFVKRADLDKKQAELKEKN